MTTSNCGPLQIFLFLKPTKYFDPDLRHFAEKFVSCSAVLSKEKEGGIEFGINQSTNIACVNNLAL